MEKITIILLVAFMALLTNERVIEVTTANVHLVVRSVGTLHLLLNNPKCPHSESYAQKYLQINKQQTIGIADCSKDQHICNYLNITHYPTLLTVSQKQVRKIDQYQFLVQNGVATEQDEQIILKKVLKLLKDDQKWLAVILEEEKLPIIDKVEGYSQKRIVYVPNPSRLHFVLRGMVGGQLGCWILVNTNTSSPLNRYYCGTGYKSDQLQKYLSHYKSGKLQRYMSAHRSQENHIQSSVIQQILSQVGRKQTQCKLVYFYSKECQHCSKQDFQLVKQVAREKRQYASHGINIFDLDRQQYPQGLTLRRVPQLIELCRGKIRYFGGLFTFKDLSDFLSISTSSSSRTQSPQNQL